MAENVNARAVPEPLMNVGEVADYIGVAERTIYRWIDNHGFPRIKIGGGSVRFRRSDVDEWIEAQGAKASS